MSLFGQAKHWGHIKASSENLIIQIFAKNLCYYQWNLRNCFHHSTGYCFIVNLQTHLLYLIVPDFVFNSGFPSILRYFRLLFVWETLFIISMHDHQTSHLLQWFHKHICIDYQKFTNFYCLREELSAPSLNTIWSWPVSFTLECEMYLNFFLVEKKKSVFIRYADWLCRLIFCN